jgi:hypothetical protein
MTPLPDNFPVTLHPIPCGDGWWIVQAVVPGHGTIVLTPECETQAAAEQLARDMYAMRDIIVPVTCPPPGNA